MSRLLFNAQSVARLVEHAQKSTKHRGTYSARAVPALHFVHDDGIYLMSSGVDGGTVSDVVYAQGFNPKTDAEVWDRARDAVGGDDFVEAIPISGFTPSFLGALPTAQAVFVDVREDSLSVGLVLPRQPQPRRPRLGALH